MWKTNDRHAQGAQQVRGGLGYVRVCALTAGAREKAHTLQERAPCSQAGAGGLRKSRCTKILIVRLGGVAGDDVCYLDFSLRHCLSNSTQQAYF